MANEAEALAAAERERRMAGGATTGYKDYVPAAEHLKAAAAAKKAGDTEAFEMIMKSAADAQRYEDSKDYDPTKGMGAFERARAGWGRAVTNIGRHAGNLVGAVPDEAIANANQLDAPLLATEGGKTGNLLGETVTTAPLGAGLTGAAGKLGAPVAEALANPITRGAFEGAAQGGLMADPGSRLEGAALGAGAGAALPAVAMGGKTAVTGLARTPEAQLLLDKGVELTPGQANPKGMYAQFEEATQSAPFVGGAIKGAREHGEESFVKAAIREAAPPGSKIPDGPPGEMLTAAYNAFEPLYAKAKGVPLKLSTQTSTGVRDALGRRLRTVVTEKGSTDQVRAEVSSFLENEFSRSMKKTDDLLKMRSEIRQRIRQYSQEPGVHAADAAKILSKAEKAVTDSLEAQLKPDALAALRAADKHYGTYKTFEDALYRAKDRPQGFTPTQLSMAARDATDPGAYARGAGGVPREMAQAGQRSLEMRVPPTGARLAPLLLGLPTGGLSYAIPAILSGTRAGAKVAMGRTKAQMKLADIGRGYLSKLTDEEKRFLGDSIRRANTTRVLQNNQDRE
jgi:hypothetical protein